MTSKQSVPTAQAVGMVQMLIDEVAAQPGLALGQAFSLARGRMAARPGPPEVGGALEDLGLTLTGSTDNLEAPLYGNVFLAMAGALQGADTVDRENFGEALTAGLDSVQTVGDTSPARRQLIDTLIAARNAYREAAQDGQPFAVCLDRMVAASQTVSQLDDAPASRTLPALILQTMARSLQGALN
ncbi:DAK2 domain-containing protein [Deinococcus marmoris]|uniref:Dihydroxyacetone kinase, ADP-binding subunit n=1 Tax=Deinococcus marmoris TaxID=249408 RepID=A0A1U7NS57_9DEIO|nr:DAK2 domain-containing protein [Deinococcus marmoris]OLV15751.1 dihydroxyacetone kinase, ADP-binding subunit [Deinococcus marmoris]